MLKYPSIENSYNRKFIDGFFERYPELKTTQYIITEKLDGSNLSIQFDKNGFCFCSRNSVLSRSDKLYDIWKLVDSGYFCDIVKVFSGAIKIFESVCIYGEYIGKGIQKRVNYGESKSFKIFDIAVNGVFLPPFMTIKLLDTVGLMNYFVPILAYGIDGLEDVLSFNVIFDSKILSITDNKAEGVVIRPLYENYRSPVATFILKKKNENFDERTKVEKPKLVVGEKLSNLRESFNSYINKNRLLGIFSKFGQITSQDDFGKYIGLMCVDAWEDFEKDFEETLHNVDKKDVKYIKGGAAKLVVALLKEFL